MKVHILIRLAMHVLVLVGLLGFFGLVPAMLPGLLMSLVRFDLVIEACGAKAQGCLAIAGLWAVVIIVVVTLVMDIRMLRKSDGVEARLWRSLAMELLLPAGWFAMLSGMGRSDLAGPAWMLLPGPAILLSAAASAVVAWLQLRGGLTAALSARSPWH